MQRHLVSSKYIIIKWLARLRFVWILQGSFLWNYKLVLHFSRRAHYLWIAIFGLVRDQVDTKHPFLTTDTESAFF